jgi:hypothetical protein
MPRDGELEATWEWNSRTEKLLVRLGASLAKALNKPGS